MYHIDAQFTFCYLLLGYYLKDRNKLSVKKTVVLSLILFSVGYAITYYGFRNMTSQPDITERQMELFFLYCSPHVFLMTVAWYLLIQKVKVTSPLIISALKNITKCGLGEQYKKNNSIWRSVISGCEVIFLNP